MNKLNSKDIKLLEKLYNLRSDNSVILVSLDEDKNRSLEEQNYSTEIKEELESKIEFLNGELKQINSEGQDLIFGLTSICQNNYDKVLDSLEISFNPDSLLKELETRLPERVNNFENDINMASNELSKVEDKLADLSTKIEELDLRKEEALADQERLNSYFELALDNNINVTREELTSLFDKFDFNDDEKRQLAKLLMFPEDGLIEYDKNGCKPLEASLNYDEKEDTKEEIVADKTKDFNHFEFESNDLNEQPFEPINFNDFFTNTDISFENPIEEKDFKFDQPIEFEPAIEETVDEPIIIEPQITEEVDNVQTVETTKEEVVEFLTTLGFDLLDFASNDVEKIVNHFDKEQITENVNLVKELDIKLDVFVDNIELLFDKELKDKVSTLTEVGKLPVDIYLNPDVLTKYDLSGLQNSINILKESGLEPKNVPLMAY